MADAKPSDFDRFYDLLERASQARWLSQITTDDRTAKVLAEAIVELDATIDQLAQEIMS